MLIKREDVVTEPDMLHTIDFFEFANLGCYQFGRADLEFISRDRFGAPVTSVGASADGDNVCGEITMSRGPCLTVRLKTDEPSSLLGANISGRGFPCVDR